MSSSQSQGNLVVVNANAGESLAWAIGMTPAGRALLKRLATANRDDLFEPTSRAPEPDYQYIQRQLSDAAADDKDGKLISESIDGAWATQVKEWVDDAVAVANGELTRAAKALDDEGIGQRATDAALEALLNNAGNTALRNLRLRLQEARDKLALWPENVNTQREVADAERTLRTRAASFRARVDRELYALRAAAADVFLFREGEVRGTVARAKRLVDAIEVIAVPLLTLRTEQMQQRYKFSFTKTRARDAVLSAAVDDVDVKVTPDIAGMVMLHTAPGGGLWIRVTATCKRCKRTFVRETADGVFGECMWTDTRGVTWTDVHSATTSEPTPWNTEEPVRPSEIVGAGYAYDTWAPRGFSHGVPLHPIQAVFFYLTQLSPQDASRLNVSIPSSVGAWEQADLRAWITRERITDVDDYDAIGTSMALLPALLPLYIGYVDHAIASVQRLVRPLLASATDPDGLWVRTPGVFDGNATARHLVHALNSVVSDSAPAAPAVPESHVRARTLRTQLLQRDYDRAAMHARRDAFEAEQRIERERLQMEQRRTEEAEQRIERERLQMEQRRTEAAAALAQRKKDQEQEARLAATAAELARSRKGTTTTSAITSVYGTPDDGQSPPTQASAEAIMRMGAAPVYAPRGVLALPSAPKYKPVVVAQLRRVIARAQQLHLQQQQRV